jgi:hypothetical protein
MSVRAVCRYAPKHKKLGLEANVMTLEASEAAEF